MAKVNLVINHIDMIPKSTPSINKLYSSKFQTTQDVLMTKLQNFFAISKNRNQMLPILTQETKISLRLLDWFVTNYSKKFNTEYHLKDGTLFNVFLSYKAQLKAYSKKRFDPFCRRDRITFFYTKTNSIITTVGQLNFFRWAISNGVLDYVINNLKKIDKDMVSTLRCKRLTKECTTLTRELQQLIANSPLESHSGPLENHSGQDQVKKYDIHNTRISYLEQKISALDAQIKTYPKPPSPKIKPNGRPKKQLCTPNVTAITHSTGKFLMTFD